MSNDTEIFREHLKNSTRLHVEQVWEGFEVILGWETRNKYRILDEHQRPVAYAAEQSKGLFSSIMRQILGHWRAFGITIFNEQRQPVYHLDFPFRWFLKTLTLTDADGRRVGHLQQQFAFFRKKFNVYDANGRVIARINSSFFRFWTFDFIFRGQSLGTIQKKWAGVLSEFFTDKDNFVITFSDKDLSADTRSLMLATCLMVDVIYFENNQKKGGVLDLFD